MFYLVMGVSGSGKSTVGKLLSDRLNCPFYDADNYHSSSNIKKMQAGIPLTDSDRKNWLLSLQNIVTQTLKQKQSAVMACSALKKSYRQIITADNNALVQWIYLRGDYQTIWQRLQKRNDHFFNQDLLQSQFDILEEPEDALTVDINKDLKAILTEIDARLINSFDAS